MEGEEKCVEYDSFCKLMSGFDRLHNFLNKTGSRDYMTVEIIK